MGQAAQLVGVSIQALRYYEREGLIAPVGRSGGKQRRYHPDDLAWLSELHGLREAGMRMERLREYARLVNLGDATRQQRLTLLVAQQEQSRRQLRVMQRGIRHITATIDRLTRQSGERRDDATLTDPHVR